MSSGITNGWTWPMRLVPVDLEEALSLASTHDLYAYDAYLLATCRAVRAPLLTVDGGLRHVAPAARVSLVEM